MTLLLELYTVFSYWPTETYLGLRFLLLIDVDRDGLNRRRTALLFGLTGPVTAVLTLSQGVICAGAAAIIHTHRTVTPYKCPWWFKQRELKGTLCCSCHFSWPAGKVTCVQHPTMTGLNQGNECLKWVKAYKYARMNYFFFAVENKKENDVLNSLKPRQNGTSPPGPQHLDFGALIFTS